MYLNHTQKKSVYHINVDLIAEIGKVAKNRRTIMSIAYMKMKRVLGDPITTTVISESSFPVLEENLEHANLPYKFRRLCSDEEEEIAVSKELRPSSIDMEDEDDEHVVLLAPLSRNNINNGHHHKTVLKRMQYSEDQRRQALIHLLTGAMTKRKASKEYGIPECTLNTDIATLANQHSLSVKEFREICNQNVYGPSGKSAEEVRRIVMEMIFRKPGVKPKTLSQKLRALIAVGIEIGQKYEKCTWNDEKIKTYVRRSLDSYTDTLIEANNGNDKFSEVKKMKETRVNDNFMNCNFSDKILETCVPGVHDVWSKSGLNFVSNMQKHDSIMQSPSEWCWSGDNLIYSEPNGEPNIASPGTTEYTTLIRMRLQDAFKKEHERYCEQTSVSSTL